MSNVRSAKMCTCVPLNIRGTDLFPSVLTCYVVLEEDLIQEEAVDGDQNPNKDKIAEKETREGCRSCEHAHICICEHGPV